MFGNFWVEQIVVVVNYYVVLVYYFLCGEVGVLCVFLVVFEQVIERLNIVGYEIVWFKVVEVLLGISQVF